MVVVAVAVVVAEEEEKEKEGEEEEEEERLLGHRAGGFHRAFVKLLTVAGYRSQLDSQLEFSSSFSILSPFQILSPSYKPVIYYGSDLEFWLL